MKFCLPINLDGDALPGDLQWLPPGQQVASMQGPSGGAVQVSFLVDEGLALRIAGQVADLRSLSDQDRGDIPFIDFGHAGHASAAEVLGAFWAGDDPKEGGVRMRVEWSALGAFAIQGRIFRRFSPLFFPDADGTAVVGVGSLLGGLANMSAFLNIARVAGETGPAGADRAEVFSGLVKEAAAAGSPDPLSVAARMRPDLFRCWFLLQPDAPMS